jgi:hypothetical protein
MKRGVLIILCLLTLTSGAAAQRRQQTTSDETGLARAAARAFALEFGFSTDQIAPLALPPTQPGSAGERDGRPVMIYRWVGNEAVIQVEVYQDYPQIIVYGGPSDQEFGPWNYDPQSQQRSFPASAGEWQTITSGTLLSVAVEKKLYEVLGSPRLFIHVQITNLVDRPIAVDLRDPWKVFYLNQWQVSDVEHRLVIDEIRLDPTEMDETRALNLLNDFQTTLTTIQPGQVIEYYRAFNANGFTDIDQAGGVYLIVVVDGQLFATDGYTVDNLYCPSDADGISCFREVAIPQPAARDFVPENALIVGEYGS